MKDYYQILGVSPKASKEEIQKAYRMLARRYHPDMNPEFDTTEKMQDLSEAYATLSDEKKRCEYDYLYPSTFGFTTSRKKPFYDEFEASMASKRKCTNEKNTENQFVKEDFEKLFQECYQKEREMSDFIKTLREEQKEWSDPYFGFYDEAPVSHNTFTSKLKKFIKK